MNKSLAKNYADALFSISIEENNFLAIQEEMKELKNVINQNPDLMTLLCSYFLAQNEKEAEIDVILKEFNENIRSMIKILCKNHRANLLVEVIDNFNSLVNEKRGILEGLIYSTRPLTQSQLEQIQNKISEIEKVPCELKNLIDSNIIGGIKVAINGHIYDGSIANKIESMRISLTK